MDTARWPQEIVMKPLEEIVPSSNNANNLSNSSSLERKVRPQKEEAVNCPRCNSINTKFCYYNNYSLSQPRFFCKTCKRYWTQGGSLRNIPIGGASRAKNKRSSSSSSSKKLPDLVLPNSITNTNTCAGGATTNNNSHQNPKIHQGQDLNLGFPTHDLKTISQLIQVPNFDHNSSSSAMELLNGISSSRGYQLMNSFMPMPVSDPSTMYSSGFSLQDLKPNLNFTLDHTSIGGDHHHSGGGGGYGDLHLHHHHHEEVQENNNNNNNNSSSVSSTGKLLFPFEDLKQVSGGTSNTTTSMDQQNRDQQQQQQQQGDSTGYWNGVLGSGSW